MRLSRLVVAAVLFGGLVVTGPGAGGQPPPKAEKEFTGQGTVKAGVHKFRMEVGKLYLVRVDADGFTPSVNLRPGNFLGTGDAFVTGDQFSAYVLPKETREYRLTVLPTVGEDDLDNMLQNYSVTVTPIPMAKQPLVEQESKLTFNDPPYANPAGGGQRGPHKAFPVNFKAGQIYIITVDAADKGNFDPYLQIEGAGGKVVAQDDDGGGYPNCRIVYKPKRGGEHRLIVTSVGKGAGSFNVKVVTTVAGAVEQPGTGAKDAEPGKE
ncbi:MAG: hypothetical protein U0804_09690 [Gemmataceae bacterium]